MRNFLIKPIFFIIIINMEHFLIEQLGRDIGGDASGDQSGYSVSLSADGTTVAIGAPFNDVNGSNSGHVRVYKFFDGFWSQLGTDIKGVATFVLSGYSVSLSADGKTVAVGAPYNDGVNGEDSGNVKVYKFDNIDWVQIGDGIDGEAAADNSGHSVSLSADGKIVAIGAPYNNYGVEYSSGHVRVYENNSGVWVKVGDDIDGEITRTHSGFSVSLSADGTTVAIGAIGNYANWQSQGRVRVYVRGDGGWRQLGTYIDGEADGDQSGFSVSLSTDGTIVAIGARYNDGVNGSYSGHVRVYKFVGGAWRKLGGDIDGEDAYDQSGWSVSLSADGTTVAIGARYNDDNGRDSGHVQVYKFGGGVWVKIVKIDGEAEGDWSGYSVSLSADGTIVAIGAPYNDGVNGSNSGHARVYKFELDIDSLKSDLFRDISYLKSSNLLISKDITKIIQAI